MKQQFEELGYQVTEAGNIPGMYVEADSGRPGPKLAIFGEMDSLVIPTHPECDPETGAVHACGHHAQCAALLGIAAALKAPGAMDGLSGSVREDAVIARQIVAEEPERYITIPEYLAKVDQIEFNDQTVTYNEDGTVALHCVK